jgi:hypothetical protein
MKNVIAILFVIVSFRYRGLFNQLASNNCYRLRNEMEGLPVYALKLTPKYTRHVNKARVQCSVLNVENNPLSTISFFRTLRDTGWFVMLC